jgi:mycothiol synthase
MDVTLLRAPPIPDLSARAFNPDKDYPAMVEVLNAVALADDLERLYDVQRLQRSDAMARQFDPRRDRFVIEANGQIIGVATVESHVAPPLGRVYYHTFDLLPSWRGKGIGTAALATCQQLLRALAEHHRDPAPGFFYSYHISSNQKSAFALLQRHGYQPFRHSFQMVRPNLENIPECPLPAGIEVRPMEDEHLRQIWDAKEEGFSDAFGFVPNSEASFEQWTPARNPNLRPELCHIAWDGNQVAGMVLIFINEVENHRRGRRRAETESINVRRPWRRRGLAKALIAQALRKLKSVGMDEAALMADADSLTGAVQLYEALGYRTIRQSTSHRRAINI